VPIPIGSWSAGGLTPGGAAFYEIQPDANGLLTAQAHVESPSLQIRLALFDAQGDLLVRSDGRSTAQPDPLIEQHVAAGVAYVEVQDLSGSGTFELGTTLQPSSAPGQTLVLPPAFQEGNYAPIAVGDFTNDGILDIVAPDGVHPGIGDGTFGAPSPAGALVDPTQSTEPSAIAVGDFNGDHNLDAAVALAGSDSVSISLGNGDGTFQPATTIPLPSGGTPTAIVAGDFGTGHVDLAVTDTTLGVVYILQGNGDGTFSLTSTIPVGHGPDAIAEGDFTGDGRTDLAIADSITGDVTILLNDGEGLFAALPAIPLPGASTPTAIVAGDFGTGHLDLAVADSSRDMVDILLGDGAGGFRLGSSSSVGSTPVAIVAGDFGNGHLDLATADNNANDVSVLMGNGDGTFQPALHAAAGTTPLALAAGVFNGNGRLDLITGNAGSNDISVLLGKGDGTFEGPVADLPLNATSALVAGDFTGNGNLGVAVVNSGSDSVTILPGNGDGTFQRPLTVPLPQGSSASAVVAADFNGDGRIDLAVTDASLDEVSILLGNGDGTFRSLSPIPVTGAPTAIVAGDFNGDGHVDLAVADGSSTVTILLGNGDGTFRVLPPIRFGQPNNPPYPVAIVAGDFNGDGRTDLAVADRGTDDVTVLIGNGDGTFQVAPPISLGGGSPSTLSLLAGDFTNDGRTDLVVASTDFTIGDSIDVLQGVGNGNFVPLAPLSLGFGVVLPAAVVAGDFNHDGNLDLATADANGTATDDYTVYLGNGDGTFQTPPTVYTLGGTSRSTAIAAGDFANDGRTSLAISRTSPDSVQVELNNGDGTFSNPAATDLVRRQTPLVADLNGDGVPDVTTIDAAGDILFRAGRPNQPGIFAPPITVNPGDPSRDIAFVDTSLGPLVASVDANDDAISFFRSGPAGFTQVASLRTGSQPAQILAADLDGTGQTDLLVRDAGDGTISLFRGDGHGWFLPRVALPVGLGASDLAAADLNQGRLLDIVVTDRLSGEVDVLQNLGGGNFAAPVPYRAGNGPYGVTGSADPSSVSSAEGTASVTSGVFTAGGLPSLVALNPGSNTFGLLAGLGGGRLSNPSIFPTVSDPLVVRAIDFNGSGLSGLAILTAGGLYIERSDGHGGFLPPTEIDVGFEPNGLTVADLNGDGKPDLLVGNPLGDVLVLIGNGDGTFQAPEAVDQQVALAVDGPAGQTPGAFIFADQRANRLVVQTPGGATTVLGNSSTGLVSPGAVKLADLNGDGIPDLIVANSGSNNVLVYPGLGNGTFGEALNGGRGFFTGTNPEGITVADVNGDGRPDLIIANKGSNTVSILINVKTAGGFTFVPGPRLQAGEGPVATAVTNLPGDPAPALLVADSGSNSVRLLRGIGNGFFNDQSPVIYPVGTAPTTLLVGQFLGGPGQEVATVNSGSNTVTLISGVGTAAPAIQSIPSGGLDPGSAFAVTLPGNTLESLVVANGGDGNISLLSAGADGFALSSVVSSPAVPNPSALELAGFSGGEMEFYATSEGVESAAVLGFQLETSGGGTPTGAPGGSTVGLETGATAQLVSLNSTSLALVGTLLTVSINSPSEAEATAGGPAVAVAIGTGPSAGQSLRTSTDQSNGEVDETGGTDAPPSADAPVGSPWARYVTGADRALEQLRSEADQRLQQEQQPADSRAVPGPTGLHLEGGGTRAGEATSAVRERSVPQRPAQTQPDRSDTVDAAVVSLMGEEPAEFRLRPLARPVSTSSGTTAAPRQLEGMEEGAGPYASRRDDTPQDVRIRTAMSIAALTVISATAARAREGRSPRIPRWRGASPSAVIPHAPRRR
jgi:hypothetical protein